jgi:hypothetical protein
LPERADHWWCVSPETDIQSLAVEVAEAIEKFAIPFFSLYESSEALLEQLRLGKCPGCTTPQAAVVHALVASGMGLKDEAKEALRSAVATSTVASFSKRVIRLAEKLEIAPI